MIILLRIQVAKPCTDADIYFLELITICNRIDNCHCNRPTIATSLPLYHMYAYTLRVTALHDNVYATNFQFHCVVSRSGLSESQTFIVRHSAVVLYRFEWRGQFKTIGLYRTFFCGDFNGYWDNWQKRRTLNTDTVDWPGTFCFHSMRYP